MLSLPTVDKAKKALKRAEGDEYNGFVENEGRDQGQWETLLEKFKLESRLERGKVET